MEEGRRWWEKDKDLVNKWSRKETGVGGREEK